MDFFKLFMSEEIFKNITNFTNVRAHLYYQSQNPQQENLNEESMLIENEVLVFSEQEPEDDSGEDSDEESKDQEESEERRVHRKDWEDVSIAEIKAYIALLLQMGITKAPN